jgi:N4-gp56 family major capsid protein
MSYVFTKYSDVSTTALDPVSQLVQLFLSQNAVLVQTVLDATSTVGPGQDSASYPKGTGFTAESVPDDDSTLLQAQAATFTVDKMDLDQHKAVLVALKERASVQSVVNLMSEIQIRQTQAIVDAMEASIYSALAATSASAPDHRVVFDTSGVVALSDISNAAYLLDVQNCPQTERFMIINPKQKKQLRALGDFTDASKYGSNEVLMTGEIGEIFGFRILATNAVTVDRAVAYHRTHAVFAMQKQMTFKMQDDLDQVATKMLITALYGAKVLDAGKRGVLMGSAS